MLNLFNTSTADYLLVANKPIGQPDAVEERLSTAKIRERFSLEYSEDIELTITPPLNESEDDERPEVKKMKEDFVLAVEERVKHPLNDSLVVCKIDDEVGSGVFTKKPIKAGEIIGVYAGRLIIRKAGTASPEYGLGISQSHALDASTSGGITRFVQHMPTDLQPLYQQIEKADLEKFYQLASAHHLYLPPFPDSADEVSDEDFAEAKENLKKLIKVAHEDVRDGNPKMQDMLKSGISIASANVMWEKFIYKGIEIICLVALRHIAENEQLGVDYGPRYWAMKGYNPKYFHKDTGMVLSPSELDLSKAAFGDLKPGFFYPLKAKSLQLKEEKDLRNAANNDDLAAVNKLIAKNVDINAPGPDTGATALHRAVEKKHYDIVRALVLAGADKNAKDNKDKSPVDLAIGDEELTSIFLNTQLTNKNNLGAH